MFFFNKSIFLIFILYNKIFIIFSFFFNYLLSILNLNFYFLNIFFLRQDLIWQEGLLIDFLQKKSVDLWIKKFLIFSAYLFNERFLFEKITKFFLDLIIWPFHRYSFVEINNVNNLFFLNIFFFLLLFFSFTLFFFFL